MTWPMSQHFRCDVATLRECCDIQNIMSRLYKKCRDNENTMSQLCKECRNSNPSVVTLRICFRADVMTLE